jgi:hypothetical protein
MPVDLCASLNRTGDYAFGSPFLNSLFGNKIIVSVLIALIVVVIVMLIYPAKKGTDYGLLIKIFIYVAAFTGIVIFLHDGILEANVKEQMHDKNSVNISSDSPQNTVYPDRKIITPNLDTDTRNIAEEIASLEGLKEVNTNLTNTNLTNTNLTNTNLTNTNLTNTNLTSGETKFGETKFGGKWNNRKKPPLPRNPYKH